MSLHLLPVPPCPVPLVALLSSGLKNVVGSDNQLGKGGGFGGVSSVRMERDYCKAGGERRSEHRELGACQERTGAPGE